MKFQSESFELAILHTGRPSCTCVISKGSLADCGDRASRMPKMRAMIEQATSATAVLIVVKGLGVIWTSAHVSFVAGSIVDLS